MKADCHIHMALDAVDWKRAVSRRDFSFVHGVLQNYRDKGFTYLRDGGDKWGFSAHARELAPEHGITYRTPLAPICFAGHYGSFIGESVDSLTQYAETVRRRRTQGADFIKIMISGLMDFDRFGVLTQPGLEPERIREMVHIAHEEGFAVMAHANGARTVEAAARAGVDSIEHGAYPDSDALHAMAEYGVIWVPTLSTVGNLRGTDRHDPSAVEAILENALERVAEFHALGGQIAPGTDAGAWAVPHGSETELPLLTLAGVTDQSLTAATAALMKKF